MTTPQPQVISQHLPELSFVGLQDSRIFTALHLPATPRALVLICPPLHAEFLNGYRREVLLARLLATKGIAAIRFHYRGTGHSDGETGDLTLEAMGRDAATALAWVRRFAGDVPAGFVGTRLGALVAADVSVQVPGAPVALWEPVIEAEMYFRDLLRVRALRELKERSGTQGSLPLGELLRRDASLDVLGYPIHAALYESGRGVSLMSILLEGSARPMLFGQIDRRARTRVEYVTTVDALRRQGWPAEMHTVIDDRTWWFAGEEWQPDELREASVNLIDRTSQFLEKHLVRGAST